MTRKLTPVVFLSVFIVVLIFFRHGSYQKGDANHRQRELISRIQSRLDVSGEYAGPWWTGCSLVDHPRLLLYNRVPKCGSEMLVLLLRWLQSYNNFRHVRLNNGQRREMTTDQRADLIKEIKRYAENQTVPVSFDRHFYFVDFTEFGEPMPTYINLLRDPVDKLISRFFYHNIGFSDKYERTNNNKLSKQEWKTQFFEQCVGSGNSLCTFISGTQYDLSIPYFCGHHPRCKVLNDDWALEKAIENLDKHFVVVGILERLNQTLAVLENRVPRFFSGVTRLFYDELVAPKMNRNVERPRKIDEKIVQTLKNNLTHEYRLYRYAVDRLETQYQKLTLS